MYLHRLVSGPERPILTRVEMALPISALNRTMIHYEVGALGAYDARNCRWNRHHDGCYSWALQGGRHLQPAFAVEGFWQHAPRQ